MVFSCFLVGTGGLLVQCGELLVARGHRVLGLLSPDPNLEPWAARRGVPFLGVAGDCAPALAAAGWGVPDYLFSIRNPWILPGEVLRLPRRLAINYHDAPLPAYAGSNAVPWALLAGEAAHGISWHVMVERVDGGDLLKCAGVPIAAGETAFSLNMKCFQAALAAFRELLGDLEADRPAPRPQDPSRRSFHSLAERPPAGGVVSWRRGAEELDRLVRALDFAGLPNLLLCPKLAAGGRFFVIRRLEMLAAPSTAPPGTLTGLDADALIVATASRDVAVRELATIDGKAVAVGQLAAELGLRPGARLPELAPAAAERLTRLGRAYAPFEPYWVERLAALEPLALPPRLAPGGGAGPPRPPGTALALPVAVPAELAERLDQPELRPEAVATIATAFAVALSRACGRSRFDLGFRCRDTAREIAGLEALYAAFVPLRVDLEGAGTLAAAAARLRDEIERTGRHGTYARDLTARSLLPWREPAGGSPCGDAVVDAGGAGAAAAEAPLALVLGERPEGGRVHLRCGRTVDAAWAGGLRDACERLLEALAGASLPAVPEAMLAAAQRRE